MHLRGTLEPLQSRRWGLEGGAQAQGWPAKRQVDSQANWTPQITRYEDMARAVVGSAYCPPTLGMGCTAMTHILFSHC